MSLTLASRGTEDGLFTNVVHQDLARGIRRVLGIVEAQGVETRADLIDLIRVTMNDFGVEPIRLSQELGYSTSSVNRWLNGKSAPHRSLWPVITGWAVSVLEARLEVLERQASPMAYSI